MHLLRRHNQHIRKIGYSNSWKCTIEEQAKKNLLFGGRGGRLLVLSFNSQNSGSTEVEVNALSESSQCICGMSLLWASSRSFTKLCSVCLQCRRSELRNLVEKIIGLVRGCVIMVIVLYVGNTLGFHQHIIIVWFFYLLGDIYIYMIYIWYIYMY